MPEYTYLYTCRGQVYFCECGFHTEQDSGSPGADMRTHLNSVHAMAV